jgi:hypothetical protein
MATIFDSDGKAAYVYNAANDTWYQVSGKTDISGTFEWTGTHDHLSSLTASDNFTAKKGTNNFLNPSARDAAITLPVAGSVCLIRQDVSGNTIHQLQYHNGSAWVPFIPIQAGNANKFLQTDGIITQWREIPDPFPVAFMMMGVGY